MAKFEDIVDIYGCHYQTLYYGEIHRDVLLNQFLSLSLAHHNLVYLFEEFDGQLEMMNNSRFYRVDHLLEMSKKNYIIEMKETIAHLIASAEEEEYKGITFFIDVALFLKKYKHDFLLFETRINDILKDLRCSFLCFYNVQEINKAITNNNRFFHTHMFLTSSIEEVESNFFNSILSQ